MGCLRLLLGVMLLPLGLLSGRSAQAGNALADPGFEDNPPGTNIHPVMGWQWYGETSNTVTETDPAHAHSGSNYFKVFGGFTGSDNWNGIYQDVFCAAGAVYQADAWAFSLSTDGGGIHGQDQFWVEVTFRDTLGNALALYRSAIITGTNITSYGGLDRWLGLKVTNQ